MQFLGKFGKIICWHPPGELAPPPRENPGSATMSTNRKNGLATPGTWCAVAWTQAQVVNSNLPRLYRTQAQVVNSNCTWAVQDPCSDGELKLYLGCTGSTLRWWTQTVPRLYRIHTQVVNSNSTSAVQDSSSGGELKLYLGCTGLKLRWWTQTVPRLYRTHWTADC